MTFESKTNSAGGGPDPDWQTSLVTGGSGFVGRHLVTHLLSRGVRVRACALPGENASFLEDLGAEVARADLTDPQTLAPLFTPDVDRVFHLGAICNLSTPYRVLRRVNVDGVDHMSALALEAGVRSFVQLSSVSVYGRWRGRSYVEDAPREPLDAYARSKRDGEDILWKRASEGLRVVVMRPCMIYGPGCTDGAGKSFSRPMTLGAIPGSGGQRLSIVRVEDVAAAAVFLSGREDAVGQAYNIADGCYPSIEDALQLAATAFGTAVPRFHLPLGAMALLARVLGVVAAMRGRLPELESDAIPYLHDDYIVDNGKLLATGFRLLYPDFAASMQDLGRRWREERSTMIDPRHAAP